MIPFSFLDENGFGSLRRGDIVLIFRICYLIAFLRFSLLLELLSSKVRAIFNSIIISYSSEEPPEGGPCEAGGISITVEPAPNCPG